MSSNNSSIVSSTDNSADNSLEAEATMTKSAYAQYCEKRGVIGIGIYVDAKLIEAVDGAAKKAGVKRNEYMLNKLIAAVNADGFAYTAPVKSKKESKDAELARLRAELAALKAQVPATPATTIVPTPPSVKADEKGNIVENAA